MKEIERKFLIKNLQFKKDAHQSYEIKQSYLQKDPTKSIRVRISGHQAWLTIKGMSDEQGLVRNEWEYSIPVQEARELLQLCDQIIEKTRYIINHKNQRFEVDEFHGKNQGLIVAEVELENESNDIEKPSWVGKEVTGKTKYYNLALLDFPYEKW